MSAARQPTACKYSRTGSPKRRALMASLSNFQTQPSSARLSEWRPMNSTMKGLSQGCSGIRRKRAKAASKVSYTRLLPMGGRVSGCRASSTGYRSRRGLVSQAGNARISAFFPRRRARHQSPSKEQRCSLGWLRHHSAGDSRRQYQQHHRDRSERGGERLIDRPPPGRVHFTDRQRPAVD